METVLPLNYALGSSATVLLVRVLQGDGTYRVNICMRQIFIFVLNVFPLMSPISLEGWVQATRRQQDTFG